MSDLFKFDSYKEYLASLIQANNGQRGYQAKLAKAAGCQPSYLSQVLTMKADLTPDQAVNLASAIGLDDQEVRYFLNLVLRSRAVTVIAKRFLEKQSTEMKRERQRVTDRISTEGLHSGALEGVYHSSWTYAAVHVATSIKGRTATSIANELRLPISEVLRILRTLEKFDMVQADGQKWSYKTGAAHLPDDSYMTEMNHSTWRQKSLSNLPFHDERSLRYTSVFTMSEKDAEALREEILNVLGRWRKKIKPSEPEVTMALLCDFFVV